MKRLIFAILALLSSPALVFAAEAAKNVYKYQCSV